MKSITTSCFSFEDIVKGGYVYVDKTDLLAKLASDYKGPFFISRPRRFGKSLMLSTLKCMFEGRRELFEGLKITKTDYDWKTYPVLHLDMARASASSIEGLGCGLHDLVASLVRQLGVTVEDSPDAGTYFGRFWDVVQDRGLQVVVLVDEYDMPLQGYLKEPEKFEIVRKMMHDCLYASNVNLTFDASAMNAEILAAILRVFAEKGSHMIQPNCNSVEQLLAAQKNLELHRNLIVRVCGFSARFISLSRRWQDEVIARHRLK